MKSKDFDFTPTDEFKIWWDSSFRKLPGYSLFRKATVIWNAARAPAASQSAHAAFEVAYPAATLARRGDGYGGEFGSMFVVWQAAVASCDAGIPASVEQVDALTDGQRRALSNCISGGVQMGWISDDDARAIIAATRTAAPVQAGQRFVWSVNGMVKIGVDANFNDHEQFVLAMAERPAPEFLSREYVNEIVDKYFALRREDAETYTQTDSPARQRKQQDLRLGMGALVEGLRTAPAAPVQAAPEGWKLMPKKLTQEMLQYTADCTKQIGSDAARKIESAYFFLYESAPAPRSAS
jgi:hypothetical protein